MISVDVFVCQGTPATGDGIRVGRYGNKERCWTWFQIFVYFQPYLGTWSNLTSVFFRWVAWFNHQPVMNLNLLKKYGWKTILSRAFRARGLVYSGIIWINHTQAFQCMVYLPTSTIYPSKPASCRKKKPCQKKYTIHSVFHLGVPTNLTPFFFLIGGYEHFPENALVVRFSPFFVGIPPTLPLGLDLVLVNRFASR